MILFMEFEREGITGGQYNLSHLYSYLKKEYNGKINESRKMPVVDLHSPFKHAIYNYREVKRIYPRMIVISIYSSCRSVFAVL